MKSLWLKIWHSLLYSLLLFSVSQYSLANNLDYYTGYKFADGTKVCYQQVPHLDTSISYLYLRERTGKNDAPEIDMFHKLVGLVNRYPGYAWCASFVSYCLYVSKSSVKIKSARALSYRTRNMIPIDDFLRSKMVAKPGDILVFQQGTSSFGHVEFIYQQVDRTFYGIGGNTSSGSRVNREGQGVFPTMRKYQPFANLKIIGVLRVNDRR